MSYVLCLMSYVLWFSIYYLIEGTCPDWIMTIKLKISSKCLPILVNIFPFRFRPILSFQVPTRSVSVCFRCSKLGKTCNESRLQNCWFVSLWLVETIISKHCLRGKSNQSNQNKVAMSEVFQNVTRFHFPDKWRANYFLRKRGRRLFFKTILTNIKISFFYVSPRYYPVCKIYKLQG